MGYSNLILDSHRHSSQLKQSLVVLLGGGLGEWRILPGVERLKVEHQGSVGRSSSCQATEDLLHSWLWAVVHLHLTLGQQCDASPRLIPEPRLSALKALLYLSK